ncbi:hypothetical protein TNCV_4810751 [Trichonephila clavipes]|nr:hypothetical protein TNCV_4810751 [Trichonephila clavipes]
MHCLTYRNVAQDLSEYTVNPSVRNFVKSSPLASQKMVSMAFVADVEVLNFLTLSENQDDDIPWIASCFLGHNDKSRMPKFRQPCANGYTANQNLSS